MGTAVALSLAVAGTAQADTVQTISSAPWSKYNTSTVTKTQDGVRFGTYADGGATGGILRYTLDSPVKLSDITDASYQFNYNQASTSPNAVPFFKLYLADGKHVMLDPTDCNNTMVTMNEDKSLSMTADDAALLYDDDGCGANAHHLTWNEMVSQHGNEKVVKIVVIQGFSGGTDVSALLKSFTFNGETFDFTGAPADGSNGSNGSNGVNGTDGAAGPAGKDGVTTIIRERDVIVGASMRTLHIRKITGMKFVSAKATLGGKKLSVHGRTIKANLRDKAVGKYIVRITAKFRAGDKTYKVRSIRSLSIIGR